MTVHTDAQRARLALAARLRSAAGVLVSRELPAPDPDAAVDAARVLGRLAAVVTPRPADDAVWLIFTALTGAFPTRDDVQAMRRALELTAPGDESVTLMETALRLAGAVAAPFATIDLVVGSVVVEVNQSARFNLHTGIQQVTRNLLPRWAARFPVVPTAWNAELGCWRRLTGIEADRLLRWGAAEYEESDDDAVDAGTTAAADPDVLVVPWRCVVVLPEVSTLGTSSRVAAIGAHSGNRLVGIAYDVIPVASADMVPRVDSGKFQLYLEGLKFADRVAAISRSAAVEFAGFVHALSTQGLAGPEVVAVPLPDPAAPPVVQPAGSPASAGPPGPAADLPMVLVVGSHEPRKNHLAILHSAEMLWRDGLQFTLQFIGGSGWGEEFPLRADSLRDAGRPIRVRKAVSDAELNQAFTQARFTVFPSLHEGYGLPIVESFAHRTPVITGNYGSTAEIAVHGGALLVDPRDDAAITSAMRALLTDDAELDRLRREIDGRPHRSWDDYAQQLWAVLVEPELGTAHRAGGEDGAA